jgi:YD repeat-containing protein
LSSNQTLLTGFQYTYDRVGNRLSETYQPGNHQTTYTYDSLYRLTTAQAPGSTLQYSYDSVGNRTMTVKNGQATAYTTNQLDQYLWRSGRRPVATTGTATWSGCGRRPRPRPSGVSTGRCC